MEVTYRRNTISFDEDLSLEIYSKWEHLHK